jgi:hypothetical protein
VQLSYHASAHKNCTAAQLPTIRVIEAPKSGTLTVRKAVLTTDKVAGCPVVEVPAQVVLRRRHSVGSRHGPSPNQAVDRPSISGFSRPQMGVGWSRVRRYSVGGGGSGRFGAVIGRLWSYPDMGLVSAVSHLQHLLGGGVRPWLCRTCALWSSCGQLPA